MAIDIVDLPPISLLASWNHQPVIISHYIIIMIIILIMTLYNNII